MGFFSNAQGQPTMSIPTNLEWIGSIANENKFYHQFLEAQELLTLWSVT